EMLLPELLVIKPPEYDYNNLDKQKQWDQQVFVPSTSPVIHSCKIANNKLPRLLEEEGFYVPRKPYISKSTYHKMEKRLLQQERGQEWFEDSGQIISLPSPVKQSQHYRISFPPRTDTLRREVGGCLSRNSTEICQLDLNIANMVFKHHSLFSCEQVLAAKLLDLYEYFQKRQQQNVTHLLSEKLKALISATKLAESNLKGKQLNAKTLKDYRLQIRNTKMLHDVELQRDNSLIQNMLKIWKQIKSVRQKQGFTSSNVKLQFQSMKQAIPMPCSTSRAISSCLDQPSSTLRAVAKHKLKVSRLFNDLSCLYSCMFREEQKRREKVKREKYFIKIYYNNKFVSSTSEAPLHQDFKVTFQQIFRIQVLNWPKSLRLEVFESNKKPTLLAKVYLPLPGNFILKSKDVLDEAEFSCEQQVKPSDGAVGSNVFFFLGENETCILTSGKLMYSLSWAVDDKGILLAPTYQPAQIACNTCMPRYIDSRKGTRIWWHSDIQKLISWARDASIDPNNPNHLELIELIMYAKSQEQSKSEYFRLEQLQAEFNFVTEEEIKNCKRFQLLQLRSLGQLSFCCLQPIPLYDREIPDIVLQMRKQVTKQIVTIRRRYNLSDIVSDYEEIISMSQLSDAIFKLGERRRHLKPQRKERRKVSAQTVSDGDVKLLIRILRAYNIPARKVQPTRYVSVRPFVEVNFQNTVYQTSTVDGSHPCWNEELQVDFISPGHDYTFSGLSKIKDNININIFDEFVIQKHEDSCPKSCSGHSYIRKNWLGSVTFPFSALLEQSKICGTFQVNMPPVLLGYTWSKTCVSPKEECHGQILKEYSFLTIFATIEPQLSSTENNLESDKVDEILLQRAYIFKQTCKILFPKRRLVTSVFNNRGRNILVTKYITSLNPPQLLLDMYPDDPNSTSELLSHFVSLIPCISDTMDENNDVDVWMTSEHCIKLGIANKEEHAVLLCNYFLYVGKKAWVLLGTSVLEGKVAYVATEENGTYFLWNPLNGQCYKQHDAFCPLQSVDCLISWENVWFNVQQNSSPMSVSFDISKECLWKQLLLYNVRDLKTQTVQPEEIFYDPTDELLVVELQNRIEKALKSKIMEWRAQQPTRWHRQCTSVLRQILPSLEFRSGNAAKEKEGNCLEAFHEHYWVTGFPIQMAYLDLQSITEAIYQTGIHSSEVPSTEFALAVYIHPYPSNMLSVWIYLVSLVQHS
uniref:Coiled-coil and C2 domain containing 2B n=1 Tax=Salvator merianae TaxID=96440 RepID=A0A8D0C515_SALMN